MEGHIIEIVRFAVCVISLVLGTIVMIRADDNNAMRRLTAVLAIVLIYFNNEIGKIVYLLIGSTIEALITAMGVGFVLICALVLMLFPLIAVVRWFFH